MASAFLTSINSLFSPVTDLYSTLEVTEGLHQGVTIPVEQPICHLGSSSHVDVMLSDTGVAEEHVTLRFHARMVAIEATGGDVRVGDRVLAQGTGWRTTLPVTFDIGDARLHLAQPEVSLPPIVRGVQDKLQPVWHQLGERIPAARDKARSALQSVNAPLHKTLATSTDVIHRGLVKLPLPGRWQERVQRLSLPRQTDTPRLKRGSVMTTLGVITLAIIGIYQLGSSGKAGASITASALHSTALLHPQAAEAALMLAGSSASPAEALREQLRQSGLDGLEVQDAGNHLVVSGHFAGQQHSDWQSVQRWFDQRYGSRQVLISNATPSLEPDRPAFRFQAVWLGENPYVINATGERLYPGAALSEGWILAEIADDGLTLRRGNDEMSLTL
ncbi:FHA domain-containing protein [Halomonas huangheensis]|nr:EscD/YscD/HrpQ family type III secretion system periplasmic domain-containing protein [Halomonas huangheensis]